MARAKVILTCPVCGQTFTKENTSYNRSRADEWEAWMMEHDGEFLCEDCYKKQKEKERQEEGQKKAEEAREAGFVDLEGSEKQVSWASRIRGEFLKSVTKAESHIKELNDKKDEATKEYIDMRIEKGKTLTDAIKEVNEEWDRIKKAEKFIEDIKKIKTASWWIDNRGDLNNGYYPDGSSEIIFNITLIKEDLLESAAEQVETESEVQENKEKAEAVEVLTPENQTCAVVPFIKVEDDKVILQSDYARDIVDVMHEISAKWDKPYWVIKITDRSGSAVDRGAEMVHALLKAGIPVKVENEEVKEKALNGTYVERQTKWIDKFKDGQSLSITWGKDEDLYSEAKKLSGARYKDYRFTVPIGAYREILDFAELNGCSITAEAMEAIEEYKASQVSVEVKDKEVIEETVEEKLEKKLEQPVEVINDLLDD